MTTSTRFTIEESEPPMTTSTTYRPRAGRKYIDAAERADQAAREAARARAAEYTDVIRACQAIRCPAQNSRFNHYLNNDLTCCRCDQTAATILERQPA